MYSKLERMSSKSSLVTYFLLAHSVLLSMMIFTFPRINEKLETQAFDLKTFGYSYSEAITMLRNLDASTVDFYLFPQLYFLDILYPILLALFLSISIIRLTKWINIDSKSMFSNLYLLPFVTMIIDYTENILISLMITSTTEVSEALVKTASIMTQLKGYTTMMSWIIILVFLGIGLKSKINSRKRVSYMTWL